MAIDLIIFDCDGVLVESEDITTRVWIESVADLGLTWDHDEALRMFRGGKMADVVAAIEETLGKPVPQDFTEAFRSRLWDRLASEVTAVDGLPEALDQIDHPTCVASNGPMRKMEVTLGTTGLLPRFEGRIFSAYEVGTFKPEPGLFLHAAQAFGALPDRCVVVEDSMSGVRAGLAAGMHVLAYEGHGSPLRAEGAVRFDDMRALPTLIAGFDNA